MGFWADRAAKSEMKVRDQVIDCFHELASELDIGIECGNLLLPCHIIPEVHNGLYINFGNTWIGIFRCQFHWWLYELDEKNVRGLGSPDSEKWMRRVGSVLPVDGGKQDTIQSFVGSLLVFLATSTAPPVEVGPKSQQILTISADEMQNTLNEAIGLLWHSGSKMKYVPLNEALPAQMKEDVLCFALQFDDYRPEQPLMLLADFDEGKWLVSDTNLPEEGGVYSGKISKSPVITALTIFQLVTCLGLSQSGISQEQSNWMVYLDKNFVEPIYLGFLREQLDSEQPEVREAATEVFESLMMSYLENPVENSTFTAVMQAVKDIDEQN